MSRATIWFLPFMFLTLFVGGASAFDAYLNLKFPVVSEVEENPMARWVLVKYGDDNDARAILLGLKFAGTLLAINILWGLFWIPRTRVWAWLSAGVLACFMSAVLCYMTAGFQAM